VLSRDATVDTQPIFPGHVLIVEDNPVNCKVVATMLARIGLTVDIAEYGFTAVERVKAATNEYGFILTDCGDRSWMDIS